MRAISLGYHDVICCAGPLVNSPRDKSVYTLRRDEFVHHLHMIRSRTGPVRVRVVQKHVDPAGSDPIYLTFDDGAACGYVCVAQELEKMDWRGHFFITTDWIGRPGFLHRQQIRELYERGHVIGSHSCSHPERMSHLKWDELVREWRESCAVLANIIGEPVKVASVPGGYYSRKVARSAAASGVEVLFTSEPTTAAALVDGCLVLGRYSVRRFTSASVGSAIAAGARWPRFRQAALWYAVKGVKRMTGPWYYPIRRFLLGAVNNQDDCRSLLRRSP